MRYLLSAAALLLVLSGAVGAAGKPSVAAEAIVARVARHYRRARTFRAHFRQVFVARAARVRRHWSGRVAADRSGKFSFVYDQPVGRRVVCDGHTVETYDPPTHQLYRTRLGRSRLRNILVFLDDPAELRRRFRFRVIAVARAQAHGGLVLEAVPRSPRAGYDRLWLHVEQQSGAVGRVLVVDSAGNANRFDLSGVELGGKLSPRIFRLRRPAGAHVVRP